MNADEFEKQARDAASTIPLTLPADAVTALAKETRAKYILALLGSGTSADLALALLSHYADALALLQLHRLMCEKVGAASSAKAIGDATNTVTRSANDAAREAAAGFTMPKR